MRRLRRVDHIVYHLAAEIMTASQVPPASPAPPIASGVPSSQGKTPTEVLTASAATGDLFTHAAAIESHQQDHWNLAMKEDCR